MKNKIIFVLCILLIICIIGYIDIKIKNIYLIKENKAISNIKDSLFALNNEINYKPVIVEKSKKVGIGEEYIAEIYLSQIKKRNIPTVIVGDVDGDSLMENSIDTLSYNEEYNTFIYRATSKKIGTFNWGGIISNFDPNNKDKKLYFTITYEIVK